MSIHRASIQDVATNHRFPIYVLVLKTGSPGTNLSSTNSSGRWHDEVVGLLRQQDRLKKKTDLGSHVHQPKMGTRKRPLESEVFQCNMDHITHRMLIGLYKYLTPLVFA